MAQLKEFTLRRGLAVQIKMSSVTVWTGRMTVPVVSDLAVTVLLLVCAGLGTQRSSLARDVLLLLRVQEVAGGRGVRHSRTATLLRWMPREELCTALRPLPTGLPHRSAHAAAYDYLLTVKPIRSTGMKQRIIFTSVNNYNNATTIILSPTPNFYRPDALSVAQPIVKLSKHWREKVSQLSQQICSPEAHRVLLSLSWPLKAAG